MNKIKRLKEVILKKEKQIYIMTDNSLWTQKYLPQNYSEFIGNLKIVKEVKNWISQYKSGKNNKKALLFYGPSGVGKTVLAFLSLKVAGYRVVEYNCNNITDIKDMRDVVRKSIGNANILDMFQGEIKPTGVILDEIDNISNGLSELNNLLKSKTEITAPIILTCNNLSVKGLKSIRNNCLEIKFSKPNKFEMEQLIDFIVQKENLNLDRDTYFIIIKNAQQDYRILLNILQDLKNKYPSQNIDLHKVEKITQYFSYKDVDLQLSEIVNKIFNKNLSFDECSRIFTLDSIMVPLYIHENYPKAILARANNHSDMLHMFSNISNNLLYFDWIDTEIYQTQDWNFTKYKGLFSSNMTNYILNHNKQKPPQFIGMSSSSLLNKTSQGRRNIKCHNNLPVVLKNKFTYQDLFILSEFIVYNLFHKNGNPELIIPLLSKLGFNFWDENIKAEDKKKEPFNLDVINTFLSINPNKDKKLTAKLKIFLQQEYLNVISQN